MTIRLAIADDHAMMRDGLVALLARDHEMAVVEAVGDGVALLQCADRTPLDVAIVDITMPEMNGIDATRLLRERHPEIRVLVLSMHSSSEHVMRALQAGATGYLLKESAGGELNAAVRATYAGERYLSRRIAHLTPGTKPATANASPLERLSAREREVLQLVVEGRSSKEIGAMRDLSPKTVETYRSRLMKKLHVRHLADLVKFAVEQGITPGSSG